MDEKEQRLREAIRKRVNKILDEISTSAGAGAYLTPKAFVGDKHSAKKHAEKMAKSIGYSLTKRGEEDTRPGDKLQENYYAYRNDETMQPHQKIGKAMSEISKQLYVLERAISMNTRLQKEYGVTNDKLWKRTTNQMLKLESRLLNMASKLRNMRG